MTELPDWAMAARLKWRWCGQARPPFAAVPAPGQISVWDFPRPPRLVRDSREVRVMWGGREIASTRRAVCVLETSHPPSFYLPWDDVARQYFELAVGTSLCEWKGRARYWSLIDGARRLESIAWSYPEPMADAELLAQCVALYPAALECMVDGARVCAQPGGFYGGWITPELVGPFKGEPGSAAW